MRFLAFIVVILFTCQERSHGQWEQGPREHRTALIIEPPPSLGPRLSRVASIFVDQCIACHNDQQADGGYSMATPESMRRAGDSKRSPLGPNPKAPANEAWGELYRRILSDDPDERMPKDSPRLDPDSIDAIYDWMVFGAKVDGAIDTPIEAFIPTRLNLEPRWPAYPKPLAVTALAIDRADEIIFSSGAGEVLAWSLDGNLHSRIPVRGRFISDIEWNASNNSLYVASGIPGQIGTVESVPWSKESSRTEEAARIVHWLSRDLPLDIAISPEGSRLAIGLQDGTVLVQSSHSNNILWKAATHAAAVTSLDWSADGKQLVSSSRDRTAKSLDSANGDVITSFIDHERTVSSVRSLNVGCVTMDEAGVLRIYPGGTASQPAANRKGFTQRTPKLTSDRNRIAMPVEGAIVQFRVRTKEIEFKDKEGKDKKKTEWRIDEETRYTWNALDGSKVDGNPSDSDPAGRESPLTLAISNASPRVGNGGGDENENADGQILVAGLADGHILVWRDDRSQPLTILNQVP